MSTKKVYIGVGHGGTDSGAVANGLKEKDVNLGVSQACMNYLANYCQVKISRTTDVDSSINNKVKAANEWGADLVVEIHHNAGGGNGAEVYYSVVGGTSKTLAQNILNSIVALGQQSRGIKTKANSSGKDYFGMIRDTKAPAVLVECAFLDSADKEIIDTAEEQKKMGEAIARGVLKTLGITEPITKTTATTTKTETTTTKTTTTTTNSSIKVKVIVNSLNIRKSASAFSTKVGTITDKGTYTITEVKGTFGKSGSWGRLKSGAGWISLYNGYVKKV